MPAATGYNRLQIALHWAVALGVGFNYIFSEDVDDALEAVVEANPLEAAEVSFALAALHVWVGMAILVLVALRIALRVVLGAPAPDAGTPGLIALWGHRLLYLGLLLVPAVGAVTWFGPLEAAGDLHEVTANALMFLAGGHALVALFHQYVLKDGLMQRMLWPR